MNRRGFLSLLGKATVGGVVAYSFPSIIVPKNIQPIGLPYFVSDASGLFPRMLTSTFPDLNSPSLELGGAILSPQLLEYTRERLNAMYRLTVENPTLSFR